MSATSPVPRRPPDPSSPVDPRLVELLDHLAKLLAREYVADSSGRPRPEAEPGEED